jgi:hypothetical protein
MRYEYIHTAVLVIKVFNATQLLAYLTLMPYSINLYALYIHMYSVSQGERSVFWEVIVSVIPSKKVYICLCPILNSFQDRSVSLFIALYTVRTSNTPCSHTSCKVRWCWRNFQKCIILGKLYQFCHLNSKY